MPQGRPKTKGKLPAGVAKKKAKATKGPAISRKSKPITPKKAKSEEIKKIAKAITKNINEAVEQELRGRANSTAKASPAAAKARTPKVVAKKASPKKKAKKASPKKKAAKK